MNIGVNIGVNKNRFFACVKCVVHTFIRCELRCELRCEQIFFVFCGCVLGVCRALVHSVFHMCLRCEYRC